MNKVFIFILILRFGLFPDQGESNSGWQLAKSKNDISIYTRRVDYSGYKEFKGEVIVLSKPEKVIDILKNIEEYKKWLPDCLESKKLAQADNNKQTNYVLTDVPWPYEDRDIIYDFVVDINPGKKQFKILIENRPDFIRHIKGIVRIPKSKGIWEITPIDDNKTKLVYQMHIEPGGYVPAWLANLKITDTPYTFLYNLREELEK